MPTASVIILNWICPIIGIVFCNFQSVAPWTDLGTAVRNAQGLNGLNPTPWGFMLGNHLGWVAYALLANDYMIFLADGPGLLIAVWLNLGAIKLMYSAHHQKQTRKSLVAFLQEKDMIMEEERKSKFQKASMTLPPQDDESSEEEDGNPDNDEDDVIPGYDDHEKKDDDETKNKDKFLEANDSIVFAQTEDSSKDLADLQESSKLFDDGLESQDKIAPLPSDRLSLGNKQTSSESFDKPNSGTFGKQKSSLKFGNSSSGLAFGNSSSGVKFGKQKSAVTFGNASYFGKRSSSVSVLSKTDEKIESMTPGEVFRLTEESGEFRKSGGKPNENSNENKSNDNTSNEKSMTHSMIFGKSKSRMNFFSSRSRKKLTTMHESLAHIGASFAKRAEKINEWGEVVWTVTSQQEPAKAPHEILVMGLVSLWFVVFVVLGFYSHYDTSEDRTRIPLLVIGYIVMVNQIFFYGAPLSRINIVIRTRNCDCIHFPSLVANTLNSGLWFAYAIAIRDPFVGAPCGLGLIFAAIQFVLCAIFKRTKKSEDEETRFSITSMLMSNSALKARMSVLAEEDTSATLQKLNDHSEEDLDEAGDLEMNSKLNTNDSKTVEYMTSFGHFSYLY